MGWNDLRRLAGDLGDLLARHERARNVGEFSRWADDPVGFTRDVLQGDPWERQVEIMETVRDSPLLCVRSANSCGKDWTAGHLALWWTYARRGLVLVTGPTERQVREVVMGEVARAFRRATDLPGELFRTALRVGDDETCGVVAFTSTAVSRLTGFHAPRLMAVITEAQGVEPWAWEGVLACATGAEDRVLALGNPLSPTGTFFQVSRPGSGWKALRIPAWDVPNVAEGKTIVPGLLTREGVERIRSMYGQGSAIYQARVEGEFPDQGEEGMFRRSWLDEAAERHPVASVRHARDPATIAVDPAWYGPDATCVAVVRGSCLMELVSWRGVDLMESVRRVKELAVRVGYLTEVTTLGGTTIRDHRGQLIVDEVGIGAGIVSRLREMGIQVVGFNSSSRSAFPNKYANLRAERYWRLRELLEAGEIALPPDEALFEELLATSWAPDAKGRVQVLGKDEIKSRLGRSPDRADATAMACGTRSQAWVVRRFAV